MVFLDPPVPNWASVSPTAALILGACDGTRSIRDLADTFGSGLAGKDDEAAVIAVIEHLEELGLLGRGIEPVESPYSPPGLQLASVHLTQACNLRCRYCLYSSGRPLPNELTTTEFYSLMDSLNALNVEQVMFIGGEPLMRADIFDIASYGKSLGLSISLLTNGTLIDRHASARIRKYFDGGVQVSLDGFQQENDRMRGDGTFEKVVEAIQLLLADEVDVAVSSTLSDVNVGRLDDFLRFLMDLGVPSFNVTNLLDYGRGKSASATRLKVLDTNRMLLSAWRRWKDRMRFDQMGDLLPHKRKRRMKCGAGDGAIEISSDGHVYGCEKKLILKESAGNIRFTDLADIYYRSPVLMETRRMVVDRDPVCSKCDFRYLCGGGCLVERPTDIDQCELREAFVWRLTELEM